MLGEDLSTIVTADGGTKIATRPGERSKWAVKCPEPDLNRYAPEGQRGLSSPCLLSTIRA